MQVIKRDGTLVDFEGKKILKVVKEAFKTTGEDYNKEDLELFVDSIPATVQLYDDGKISVEVIQDAIERWLMFNKHYVRAKASILYRAQHKNIRDWVNAKRDFINKYKDSYNNSDATVDDNSNVSSKNVGIANNESHKQDNINISRGITTK